MSTIIIITPPPTKPQAESDEQDGFAQATVESDYAAARGAIERAESSGARVRIIREE